VSAEWLEEAVRAARDVGEARRAEAARTGVKVARTLAGRARRRRRIPWIGLAAATLAGSAAWASGGPARLAALLGYERDAHEVPAVIAPGARARTGASHATRESPRGEGARDQPELARAALSSLPPASAPPPPGPAVPESAPSPRAPVSRRAAPPASPPAAPLSLASSAPPPPPADLAPPPEAQERPAELAPPPRSEDQATALYTEAHTLHFAARDPARALVAWERYLAIAPAETHAGLVLEARYNRAICFVRLHRRGEAREALAPFAAGVYGGYRQEEARALLAAPLLREPSAPAGNH
jgi:hypothetical protein